MFPPHLKCVTAVPCETLKVKNANDFNGVMDVRIQNLLRQICGCLTVQI